MADPDVTFDILPVPLSAKELSFQEIYLKCSEAIVGITAYVSDGSYYWGTGIIFSSDG
jgi:hypothetical protein